MNEKPNENVVFSPKNHFGNYYQFGNCVYIEI